MKILLVVGTRPEVIKTAGLVFEQRNRPEHQLIVCSTGQHRTMLDESFADLGIEPDFDLGAMDGRPGLAGLTARMIEKLCNAMEEHRPDCVLVQGDTTTAMTGALAAYYNRVAIGHIEAGLRTGDPYSPWPEEGNRKLVGALAHWHFAPTETAKKNLLDEGVSPERITVTGNTVIDALLHTRAQMECRQSGVRAVADTFEWLDRTRKLVLVTGHRRENFGKGFEQICLALKRLAERDDIEIVYPVHLNPNVRGPVHALLGDAANVHLIEPLSYTPFVYLMSHCHFILTDSGGIQEEAPSLGKPVLVMRDTSERMEAVHAGAAKLVGTDAASIVAEATSLLEHEKVYEEMSTVRNPFGDGKASRRILDVLRAA